MSNLAVLCDFNRFPVYTLSCILYHILTHTRILGLNGNKLEYR